MSNVLITIWLFLWVVALYLGIRNEFVYRKQITWIRQNDIKQYLSYNKMMLEFWKWKY